MKNRKMKERTQCKSPRRTRVISRPGRYLQRYTVRAASLLSAIAACAAARNGPMVPRQALPESGGFLEEICVIPGLRLAQGCYFRLARAARSRSTPGKGKLHYCAVGLAPSSRYDLEVDDEEMREVKTDPGGVLELNCPKGSRRRRVLLRKSPRMTMRGSVRVGKPSACAGFQPRPSAAPDRISVHPVVARAISGGGG